MVQNNFIICVICILICLHSLWKKKTKKYFNIKQTRKNFIKRKFIDFTNSRSLSIKLNKPF